MHFKLNSTGNAIDTLTMDALGTISLEPQKLPVFTAEAAGTVSLESSSLRKIDGDSRIYNLQANPATSTDHKMPYSVDIKVHISKDGKTIVSADDDYLFVAQQMAQAPSNWKSPVTKANVGGNWNSTNFDSNAKIKARGTVSVNTAEVLRGASIFKSSLTSYYGVYKEVGYGYAFGYTSGKLKSDGSNYDGIQGAILVSPDNSFGLGYDASNNGGAFIVTK